jgi:cephalosporin-C deacetylase-like acetyl esterase
MEERTLCFFSDERQLRGTLVLPEQSGIAPVVVPCHGFGSYEDDVGAFPRLAEVLAREGFASFRFGFSGSDPYLNKGTIRIASEWVNDCRAAVMRVRQVQEVDGKRIALLGISIGGGVVIQAAALCKAVRCVVALAPVADGEAWLHGRWLITRTEEAWQKFVAEVEADIESVVLGRSSRIASHFEVQVPFDRGQWNALLERFPRLLREMTLLSIWDTFHFKPYYYAHALTQPLLIVYIPTHCS